MDRVLHTNTAVRNDLLGNYVKVVERDYDLPNPLVHPMGIRRTHAPTQTATNLRTSQAQSTPRHQEVNRGRHSQQRLSLTQQPKTPVQRPSSIPAPYPGTPLHSPQSTPLQASLSQTIARQQAPTHSYRRTTLPSPRPVVTSQEQKELTPTRVGDGSRFTFQTSARKSSVSRTSSLSSSQANKQLQEVPPRFRYCVGCEDAIL